MKRGIKPSRYKKEKQKRKLSSKRKKARK